LATNIVMPQMGYDMREGTVVKWHKQEGEPVARGEVIADIETDKATVEFEAYTGGVLRKIVAREGVAVPVGELIAVIAGADEELPAEPAAPSNGAAAAEAEVASQSSPGPQPGQEPPAAAPLPQADPGAAAPASAPPQAAAQSAAPAAAPEAPAAGGVRASPIARRLARERGLDLSKVKGTGPGGRIVEKDVLEYTPAPAAPEPAPATAPAGAGERVELTRMRQAIARVTRDSKREAPHFYVTAEVDMTRAMSLRREINDALPSESRVSVNDLIIRAAVIALKQYPKFNGSFQGDYLQMNASMNIGIAIALESGLMVPGISNCQDKSLQEIAAASKDLGNRARSGHLRNDEYSGTTFSISNLGMFDVDSFAAIIFPPHAAVLAVGTVKEQAVVRNGELAIAQMMKATLSTDHRVADGAEAAEFLVAVKKALENPVGLLL
jgi:pyruvate dehydrogenase E2 component (dihydrolipoamide acetyltransferase)